MASCQDVQLVLNMERVPRRSDNLENTCTVSGLKTFGDCVFQSPSCDSSSCDGVSVNSLSDISMLQFKSVADFCQGFQQGQPFLHKTLITLISLLCSHLAKLIKAESG